jgi:hypothetical protein
MKQAISKSGVFAVAEKTIDTKEPQVIKLMQHYGMNVKEGDSRGKVDKAFLSLLPRSRGFRKDFSELASEVAKDMTVGQVSMTGVSSYLNSTGRGIDTTSSLQPLLAGTTITVPSKTSTTTTKTEPKTFENTRLGQILSNESIQNLLNTGLSVWAYKKTSGGVGGTSSDNILNSATVGGSGTEVSGGTNQKTDDKKKEVKGIDPTTTVLLVVGGLAVVGAVYYFVIKK